MTRNLHQSVTLLADGLACQRGGRLVFSDLSFSLESGKALVLRGPNGSGKTSLLRLLAGLLPIADGEVLLNDTPIRRSMAGYRELMHYTGHSLAIKPAFSVRDNLAFWARYYGDAGDHVMAALDAFDLADLAEMPVRILSAGQQKRLSLARMLVAKRPVWLLDEPTVALDSHSQDRLFSLVKEHLDTGGLVVAATHMPLVFDHLILDMAGYQATDMRDEFFGQDLETV